MYHTDTYSQHSSIIRPVYLNGWVFVYELIAAKWFWVWASLIAITQKLVVTILTKKNCISLNPTS